MALDLQVVQQAADKLLESQKGPDLLGQYQKMAALRTAALQQQDFQSQIAERNAQTSKLTDTHAVLSDPSNYEKNPDGSSTGKLSTAGLQKLDAANPELSQTIRQNQLATAEKARAEAIQNVGMTASQPGPLVSTPQAPVTIPAAPVSQPQPAQDLSGSPSMSAPQPAAGSQQVPLPNLFQAMRTRAMSIPSAIPGGASQNVDAPYLEEDIRRKQAAAQFATSEAIRAKLAEPITTPEGATTTVGYGSPAAATITAAPKKSDIEKEADDWISKQPSKVNSQGQPLGISDYVKFKTGDLTRIDPIISSQIGDIPQQAKGEDPVAFKARLAQWGQKAQDIKVKMTTDPAIARAVAYGLNRPVVVMDSTGIHYTTAGEAEKSGAAPATPGTASQSMSREAVIQDVRTSMEQLREAAKKVNFDTWQRAKVAAVLANPSTTAGNFVNGAIANTLSPEEQDYVIQALNTREQIYGLRRALTGSGGGSDQQSAQILKTLPGANTPNFAFADKQITTAQGVLDRLEKGIPKLGSAQVGPQNGGVAGKIIITAPDGSKHPFDTQVQADTFKRLAGIK